MHSRKTANKRSYRMSGLRFARGSAKGGKLMQDCCFTCKNLEYRKNYVYPYRCLKHKADRFSEKDLEHMCFSGEECKDYEDMDRRKT
jgi:hypothetical protein